MFYVFKMFALSTFSCQVHCTGGVEESTRMAKAVTGSVSTSLETSHIHSWPMVNGGEKERTLEVIFQTISLLILNTSIASRNEHEFCVMCIQQNIKYTGAKLIHQKCKVRLLCHILLQVTCSSRDVEIMKLVK